MKQLSFSIFALVLAIACTNQTEDNNSANSNIDSISTAPIDSTKATDQQSSQYTPLNTSTYIGKVALTQEKAFLSLVSPKQAAVKTENDAQHRSDTLYAVYYIPYKDQEVYLYQSVLSKTNSSSANWCFSIIKNGEILINEHVITQEKYTSMILKEMKLGDPSLEFIGITAEGTEETLSLPYDGKSIQ